MSVFLYGNNDLDINLSNISQEGIQVIQSINGSSSVITTDQGDAVQLVGGAPDAGDVLQALSSSMAQWVSVTTLGGVTLLSQLNDVSIASPLNNQGLIYGNDSKWHNASVTRSVNSVTPDPSGNVILTSSDLPDLSSIYLSKIVTTLANNTLFSIGTSAHSLNFDTSPIIGHSTLALPPVISDTIVTQNATQSLTHKTIDSDTSILTQTSVVGAAQVSFDLTNLDAGFGDYIIQFADEPGVTQQLLSDNAPQTAYNKVITDASNDISATRIANSLSSTGIVIDQTAPAIGSVLTYTSPDLTFLPLPPTILALSQLSDVSIPIVSDKSLLRYNSAASTWGTASDALYVHVGGSETITGVKTFTNLLQSDTSNNATLIRIKSEFLPSNTSLIASFPSTMASTANDTFVMRDSTQTLTNKLILDTNSGTRALTIGTTGSSVSINQTAPSAGQVLTASSSIAASWQTPSTTTTFNGVTILNSFIGQSNLQSPSIINANILASQGTNVTLLNSSLISSNILNSVLGQSNVVNILDSQFTIIGNVSTLKQAQFMIDTLPSATTATLNVLGGGDLVLATLPQTLTAKTSTDINSTARADRLSVTGASVILNQTAPSTLQFLVAGGPSTASWSSIINDNLIIGNASDPFKSMKFDLSMSLPTTQVSLVPPASSGTLLISTDLQSIYNTIYTKTDAIENFTPMVNGTSYAITTMDTSLNPILFTNNSVPYFPQITGSPLQNQIGDSLSTSYANLLLGQDSDDTTGYAITTTNNFYRLNLSYETYAAFSPVQLKLIINAASSGSTGNSLTIQLYGWSSTQIASTTDNYTGGNLLFSTAITITTPESNPISNAFTISTGALYKYYSVRLLSSNTTRRPNTIITCKVEAAAGGYSALNFGTDYTVTTSPSTGYPVAVQSTGSDLNTLLNQTNLLVYESFTRLYPVIRDSSTIRLGTNMAIKELGAGNMYLYDNTLFGGGVPASGLELNFTSVLWGMSMNSGNCHVFGGNTGSLSSTFNLQLGGSTGLTSMMACSDDGAGNASMLISNQFSVTKTASQARVNTQSYLASFMRSIVTTGSCIIPAGGHDVENYQFTGTNPTITLPNATTIFPGWSANVCYNNNTILTNCTIATNGTNTVNGLGTKTISPSGGGHVVYMANGVFSATVS